MWHTQKGDRKLEGKERALFVPAAVELYDLLDRAEGGLWLIEPVSQFRRVKEARASGRRGNHGGQEARTGRV